MMDDEKLDALLSGLSDEPPPPALDQRVRAAILSVEVDDPVGEALARLPDEPPPPALDQRVREHIRSSGRRWGGLWGGAAALAAGLLLGVLISDGPRYRGGDPAASVGHLSVSGDTLLPTSPVPLHFGAVRPSLQSDGPVTVEWRAPDPAAGLLVVWWVAADDGKIYGIDRDGKIGGEPRTLPSGTQRFTVRPEAAGTLMVLLSREAKPDASALAETLRDGRIVPDQLGPAQVFSAVELRPR
jgi:hypothetical protein